MSEENEVIEDVEMASDIINEPEEETVDELPVEPEEVDDKPNNKYMGRQEWEDSGKDPDAWVPEKAYNDIGRLGEANKRLHQKVDHLEQTYGTKIDAMDAFHQAQLSQQRNDLLEKRNEAIDNADSEEVTAIEQQINTIDNANTPPSQQQQYLNEVGAYFDTVKVNAKTANPGKSQEIDDKMFAILSRHQDPQAAADEFNAYVSSFKPTPNPRRQEASVTATTAGKRTGKATMKTLTLAEKDVQKWFQGDDKAFLLAVNEERKRTKQ